VVRKDHVNIDVGNRSASTMKKTRTAIVRCFSSVPLVRRHEGRSAILRASRVDRRTAGLKLRPRCSAVQPWFSGRRCSPQNVRPQYVQVNGITSLRSHMVQDKVVTYRRN
jgi:hypothetical protein